ncbi:MULTISPECIES: D-alanine--D-alanine ligase family protein [unclassified Pseudomonas]|uniref:D-alanine--D-alanine ligase family protein n=1 Tax=unclassified Pseudomonas TaxID=196821 RepID=UPI0025D12DFD|nr:MULTISPECIES: ATP-grasp domain-containing protein [unclassified Pseudomonas]
MGNVTLKMDDLEVSLVFGGMSPEHAASRASFSFVYQELTAQNSGVALRNIYYVDLNNRITCRPFEKNALAEDYMRPSDPVDYAAAADMMSRDTGYLFNLLHGNYGEDGHVQGLANLLKLRGSFGPVLPASLAMSKVHMQRYVSGYQKIVKVPDTWVVTDSSESPDTATLLGKFGGTMVVVKPNSLGASLFTECYTVTQAEVPRIIENLSLISQYDERALVQAFVSGTEYSIGCVRLDNRVVALPAVRIDTARGFFGHQEKHRRGNVQEILVEEDTPVISQLKAMSCELFDDLGFAHMCRFDYIVTGGDDIYFLEANPIPGLMRNSILPKMLKKSGISIAQLIRHFSCQDAVKAHKRSAYDYSID